MIVGKGLLVLEGIDQSGKKTQAQYLAARLSELYSVEEMRFPDYSTPVGKEIKAFLSGKRAYNLQVRHILYAANRWERKEKIDSWLGEGKLVVVDRYSESNLAYGIASGLELSWLMNLERDLPKADLVIVLDVSPETSLKRKRRDRDTHERDLAYLQKVSQAYLSLSQRLGWTVINGEKEAKEVHSEIWKAVENFLRLRAQ